MAAFGIAAPSPSPVKKRSNVSIGKVVANAVNRLKPPNSTSDSTNTFLRPMRSANGPAVNAPTASPTSAALITGPSEVFSIPQSCTNEVAIKPMIAVSKPSSATVRKHKMRISHW
ncbi:hypothetical protein D3C80_1735970 [compost metagenome]